MKYENEQIKKTLLGFVVFRIGIITLFLGIAASKIFSREGTIDTDRIPLLFVPIGFTFAISAINALLLKNAKRLILLGYLQLVTDVILATLAIAVSGSPASNVLYLIVIVGASLLFQKQGAVIISALSALLYSLLQAGMIPSVGGVVVATSTQDVLMTYFSFILIAFIGSYLTEQIASLGIMVDRHSRDLTDLTAEKQKLSNDVSRMKGIEEKLEFHEKMSKLLADDIKPSTNLVCDVCLIGESQVMQRIYALVDKIAQSDAAALVTGESGTGKELIARAIHGRSPRKKEAFVAINCGAIPENLIESELFGHKKGSFTGAISDNPGLFRQANRGTLFLDEIGELPLHLQTKLLRVLQDKKVRAVGDTHDVTVDVRIVAATNRDLKKEIVKGTFREDLFYRLNVVGVLVPPLRDRKEDIPILVRHFIGKMFTHQKQDEDRVLPVVSPEAIQLLMNYNFPGNIRELENIIERAIVLGGQAILPEHFPQELQQSVYRSDPNAYSNSSGETQILVLPVNLEDELAKIEKELLAKALDKTGGMKKQAAELLGLNFRSFRYRLKKYGLGEDLADQEGVEERA
jgi:transcriptional regulator with GAF, ATPase, and Fis domain